MHCTYGVKTVTYSANGKVVWCMLCISECCDNDLCIVNLPGQDGEMGTVNPVMKTVQ